MCFLLGFFPFLIIALFWLFFLFPTDFSFWPFFSFFFSFEKKNVFQLKFVNFAIYFPFGALKFHENPENRKSGNDE